MTIDVTEMNYINDTPRTNFPQLLTEIGVGFAINCVILPCIAVIGLVLNIISIYFFAEWKFLSSVITWNTRCLSIVFRTILDWCGVGQQPTNVVRWNISTAQRRGKKRGPNTPINIYLTALCCFDVIQLALSAIVLPLQFMEELKRKAIYEQTVMLRKMRGENLTTTRTIDSKLLQFFERNSIWNASVVVPELCLLVIEEVTNKIEQWRWIVRVCTYFVPIVTPLLLMVACSSLWTMVAITFQRFKSASPTTNQHNGHRKLWTARRGLGIIVVSSVLLNLTNCFQFSWKYNLGGNPIEKILLRSVNSAIASQNMSNNPCTRSKVLFSPKLHVTLEPNSIAHTVSFYRFNAILFILGQYAIPLIIIILLNYRIILTLVRAKFVRARLSTTNDIQNELVTNNAIARNSTEYHTADYRMIHLKRISFTLTSAVRRSPRMVNNSSNTPDAPTCSKYLSTNNSIETVLLQDPGRYGSPCSRRPTVEINSTPIAEKQMHVNEQRSVAMIISIVVIFAVCHIFAVINAVGILVNVNWWKDSLKLAWLLNDVNNLATNLNSCINPFLYIFFSKRFQLEFQKRFVRSSLDRISAIQQRYEQLRSAFASRQRNTIRSRQREHCSIEDIDSNCGQRPNIPTSVWVANRGATDLPKTNSGSKRCVRFQLDPECVQIHHGAADSPNNNVASNLHQSTNLMIYGKNKRQDIDRAPQPSTSQALSLRKTGLPKSLVRKMNKISRREASQSSSFKDWNDLSPFGNIGYERTKTHSSKRVGLKLKTLRITRSKNPLKTEPLQLPYYPLSAGARRFGGPGFRQSGQYRWQL